MGVLYEALDFISVSYVIYPSTRKPHLLRRRMNGVFSGLSVRGFNRKQEEVPASRFAVILGEAQVRSDKLYFA